MSAITHVQTKYGFRIERDGKPLIEVLYVCSGDDPSFAVVRVVGGNGEALDIYATRRRFIVEDAAPKMEGRSTDNMPHRLPVKQRREAARKAKRTK